MNEAQRTEFNKAEALKLTPDVDLTPAELIKRVENAALAHDSTLHYGGFKDVMSLERIYQTKPESLTFEQMKRVEQMIEAGISYALQKLEEYAESLPDNTLHTVEEVPTDINFLFDACDELQKDGVLKDTEYVQLSLLRKRIYAQPEVRF